MPMWEKLKGWVRKWLGINPPEEQHPVEKFAEDYEDIRHENITAIIANKLSILTFADSTMTISNNAGSKTLSARTAIINDVLTDLWENDAPWIIAQMLGKGGKVLVPTVSDGTIHVSVIDQSRMRIIEMDGRRVTTATILVDTQVYGDKYYYLLADYILENDVQRIAYRIVDDGDREYLIGSIEPWESITPEVVISNTDRLLMCYIRSPRDNRSNNKRYGVPITFGAEKIVDELVEHANIYRREYMLTRPMLGLDSSLWRNPNAQSGKTAPITIDSVRKTVQDGDDPFIPFETSSLDGKGIWQHFAPAIRQEAMEARYQSLCRRVEKACGVSQGILTERQTMNYANRDEVRAAQYDTFSVVKAVRDEWERGMDDLAYAIDVLAEHFGLSPAGSRNQYEIKFDWDQSLIESTEQTFAQMSELQTGGMVSKAELRQWVLGGSIEEAEQAVQQIAEENASNNPLDDVLSGIRAGGVK